MLYKNKEWLHKKYMEEMLSTREIAEIAGCNPETVRLWMKKFDIERRAAKDAHMRKHNLPEEQRKKMSDAMKGSKNPMYGKNFTDEHRKKLSDATKRRGPVFKGHKHSEKTKSKISDALKGRPSNTKGTTLSDEHKRKISKALKGKMVGKKNPMYGKQSPMRGTKLSNERKQKLSEVAKQRTGDANSNWKGGISFEPYCQKFDNELRERIREEFDHKCFLCGKPEVNRKLCVHHVDYNKGQGCGHSWSLVPLCISCHIKTNYNRWYWFCLLNSYWAQNIDINFNSI